MRSLTRLGALLIFLVLNIKCQNSETRQFKNLDGYYKCMQTAILLSSFVEEKTDLYNTCLNTKLQIQKQNVYFDTSCAFFAATKIMSFDDSLIDNKVFDLDNMARFLAAFDIDQEYLMSNMKLYKGSFKDFRNHTEDFMLLSLGKDTVIFIDQPYILLAKKMY